MNTHRGTKGRASYVISFEDWESVGEKKWFFGFFFFFFFIPPSPCPRLVQYFLSGANDPQCSLECKAS